MSARPSIGDRGRRFTLEVPLDAPDGFGGQVRTWQPGPLLWGALEMIGAGERVAAGERQAFGTHRATFAWRDGIGPDHRLTLGLRRFRIKHAADPDGRRRALVCLLEEIVA